MMECLCVDAAADRKGFARQLGHAIKRPSSTSDIKDPGSQDADSKGQNQKALFPPTYEDPSVPPAFTRKPPQVPSALTPNMDSYRACCMLSAASALQGTPSCCSAAWVLRCGSAVCRILLRIMMRQQSRARDRLLQVQMPILQQAAAQTQSPCHSRLEPQMEPRSRSLG